MQTVNKNNNNDDVDKTTTTMTTTTTTTTITTTTTTTTTTTANYYRMCFNYSQATDADTGNGSIVWYRIETENAPFVVDLDTGVVTTVGIFKGQSGTSLEVVVRAFDNFGTPPTQSSTGTMIVSMISYQQSHN